MEFRRVLFRSGRRRTSCAACAKPCGACSGTTAPRPPANGPTSPCSSRCVTTRRAMPRPCSPSTRWSPPSTRSRASGARPRPRRSERSAGGHARSPAPRRQRPGENLSLHALGPRRIRVPAPADLLGLRGRSDRAIRPVGGRVDGAGAPAALSPPRHLRPRLRAGDAARGRTLVSAVALRALARHPGGAVTPRPRSGRNKRAPVNSRSNPLPAFVGRSEQERAMVALTFPDGARRDYPNGPPGLDVAKGISPSLAKRTVAMALDGVVGDLSDPIEHDARIEFLTREDKRALELIRHDAAHVLAEALQNLWPGTQVTIGPVIENGFYYDFFRNQPFTPEDFPAIETEMRKIIARDRSFTKEVWDRDKTKQVFRDKGELFKVELVDAIQPGEPIKIYKQGDWFDLCRGPHMTSTGKVGPAFKLMKTAGAYWRGDSRNPMLTRIYGTAFASQAELDAYLKQLEEAEKRDHRRLGREMDLFHFQEEAPGSVFWHAKGWSLFRLLEDYIRRRQTAAGYLEVNAPQLMDSSLWVASGHMETFREAMFLTQPREEDERVFVVKPMNCPGHIQIFKNGLKSYRDLPFKLTEFGKVHRFEPSGALHGLMRVRAFTQDDAHVFITEDDIARECLAMNDLILSIYEDFGFSDVTIKFSDRPQKRIGADEVWDKAEAALKQALETSKRPWTLNKGEGAFYGPKLEYVLRDAIGRDWQCGTVQVDLNMPGRLGAFYIDEHSHKVTPVMLHRAMFGSLERFTGIMIEHYAGHLPLWLAPMQAGVATITSDADGYAREAVAAAQRMGLRVEDDLRNEKINYKVREHSLAKIPVLLVVGKKEAADRAVSIRRLGSQQQTVMPLDRALAMLADEAVAPDVRRLKAAA